MRSTTDVKVVHLIKQSSPTDRTTEFTLLQRKKTKHLDSYQADKYNTRTFWVVFMAWMRAGGARPILSCFSQPDKSKRAKKTLELTIPKPF
jgi:hypothetical protein